MRQNERTRITGSSVILVPYKEKHVERYHQWMKSEELQRLTGSEPLTLQEEYQMQKKWHQDEDKCTFIVLDKNHFRNTANEIESMIGDTNLFFNDPEQPRSAEAEIMIAETEYRGKRIGWEAMILMLLYGVDVLSVTRYQAKIKADNQRSINMFKKMEFQEVDKNDIFQEITLEKMVEQSWADWLYFTMGAVMEYGVYND